jgi:FkbM family methyltransferase
LHIYRRCNLVNPYRTTEKLSFFLRLYRLFPDNEFRAGVFRGTIYKTINAIINIYGIRKIRSRSQRYFAAEYRGRGGFRFRESNSQFHSIYFERYRAGYEPDVAFVIRYFLPRNGVFFDIGANWGHHTFYAIIERDAKAVAFEPNPQVFRDLTEVGGELQAGAKLVPIRAALSNSETEIELLQKLFESGVASIGSRFTFKKRYKKAIANILNAFGFRSLRYRVECKVLDKCGSYGRPDLIKIDAEGAELDILNGGRNLIREAKPYICFEYYEAGDCLFGGFVEFFNALSYDLYCVSPHRTGAGLYDVHVDEMSPDRIETGTQYNVLAVPRERGLPSAA